MDTLWRAALFELVVLWPKRCSEVPEWRDRSQRSVVRERRTSKYSGRKIPHRMRSVRPKYYPGHRTDSALGPRLPAPRGRPVQQFWFYPSQTTRLYEIAHQATADVRANSSGLHSGQNGNQRVKVCSSPSSQKFAGKCMHTEPQKSQYCVLGWALL